MEKLIAGLKQFVRTVQEEEQELYAKLASGQRPETLFVTCSDSRIAPHKMTRTGPGELFVIRNAGNIVPPHGHNITGEAATVEYAVNALGVKDIIVCGHSNCGAMKGLLNLEALEQTLPNVRRWLEFCQPTRHIVERQFAELGPDQRLDKAIELNVLAQLDNLRSHPSVAAHVYSGDVRLHAWVYDIPTGHVRAFDSTKNRFVSLLDGPPPRGVSVPMGQAAAAG